MTFTPGQRITARSEDFLINHVDANYDGSYILHVEGLSELVKGRRFVLDTVLDPIQAVDPGHTQLIPDTETGYRKTKLFIETHLRNTPLYHHKITIAQKAAFNPAAYQLTPTLQALSLPRPRILIADGVGLGKTIEAGIFLAEMIRRGKGKRILILALKSILGQFQQELWNRFAIPLIRFDSQGIDRVKIQLPAHKNPFDYYDKTIISIDTLKNNSKFRHYIEKSHWDIIVIDECHTVANMDSQRGDLAHLLSNKCESLVLTSATPHNGRKESFANLIRMIEPTAIARSGAYTKEDVAPYYVRRFKNDIQDAVVRANFQDRKIVRNEAALHPLEEDFLGYQQSLKFDALHRHKKGKPSPDFLFATGLFKAYMSSPAAALATVERRLEKVLTKAETGEGYENDLDILQTLQAKLHAVLQADADSKYRTLRDTLLQLGWSGQAKNDRIVIFAERIDTLNYLEEKLKADFKLKDNTLQRFDGSFGDMEQQAIVEDFGKEDSNIRILLCSDAGSQGVNLHYYCHRMFNYDIPWSLITLEQRNGRIDRYGQKHTPFIHYIVATFTTDGLKTDLHIIDRLTQKEEVVYQTLGDAGSVMKLYDAGKEETAVIQAIQQQEPDFFDQLEQELKAYDRQTLFGAQNDTTAVTITQQPFAPIVSLYKKDEDYYKQLFEQLITQQQINTNEVNISEPGYVELLNTKELNELLYDMPPEAKPEPGELYKLTLDKALVQRSIDDARKKKGAWAEFQLLYELHPVVHYCMTKLEASVAKNQAPVAKTSRLPAGTACFVLHGQVSNQLGQPVISDFFVIPLRMDGTIARRPLPLGDFIAEFALDSTLYTEHMPPEELEQLHSILPDAIDWARDNYMLEKQERLEATLQQQKAAYEAHLQQWKQQSMAQLELDFEEQSITHFWRSRKENRQREIETILTESSQYNSNLNSLRNDAYIRVLAVFYNQ